MRTWRAGASFRSPITYNVQEVVEGYATLRKLATSRDHVVPGHDPLVLARYPAAKSRIIAGVVRAAATISQRLGYRRTA